MMEKMPPLGDLCPGPGQSEAPQLLSCPQRVCSAHHSHGGGLERAVVLSSARYCCQPGADPVGASVSTVNVQQAGVQICSSCKRQKEKKNPCKFVPRFIRTATYHCGVACLSPRSVQGSAWEPASGEPAGDRSGGLWERDACGGTLSWPSPSAWMACRRDACGPLRECGMSPRRQLCQCLRSGG